MADRKVDLSRLSPAPGSRRKVKRIGRGPGSGHGKTATRGNKGQRSRSGSKAQYFGFEGGQMPLHRRIPKRGFTNSPFRKEFACVNLGRLEVFEAGTIVTPELLMRQGIVRKLRDGLKVLADGQLTKALTVHAHRFSGKAQERIAALGGKAELIQG
jgi:large subunit ribosomal protein L15